MMIRWLLIVLLCGLPACGPKNPPEPRGNIGNTTEPVPAGILFFSFGDWGTGSDSQKETAQAVRQFCQLQNCDFGVLLGDNFYNDGVQSINDPLWDLYFETIYPQLRLPFYAALGNHDHQGNPQAQIDYTEVQERWKMPARRYSVAFPSNTDTPLLQIFVEDSTTYQESDGDQLDQALKDSAALWKILVIHHPFYSNGSHGDTGGLIHSHLLPLICNQVDVVLSGHDHLFSHLFDPGGGCRFHQLVVGTGGKDLYPTHSDARALYSESAFGFASVAVGPDALRIRFHESNGGVPYDYLLKK